jgi:metal-responsive CopG/Arc/MetJ family transcriptional regulator
VDHTTIKLPTELLNDVKKFIQENQRLGYTSPAEYIKDKLRKSLKEDTEKKD